MSTITSVTIAIAYAALMALARPALAEAPTAKGRIDSLIQGDRPDYVEFKADATAVEALRPVWDRGYEDPYRTTGLPVPAFGLRFDAAAIGGHPHGDRSGTTPWGITAGLQAVQSDSTWPG